MPNCFIRWTSPRRNNIAISITADEGELRNAGYDLTAGHLLVLTGLTAEGDALVRRATLECGAAGLQGAVVVTDPRSGHVQAVVGGREPRAVGFNRALDAHRPIGSLVKPAVYLSALSRPARFTLASPGAGKRVSIDCSTTSTRSTSG